MSSIGRTRAAAFAAVLLGTGASLGAQAPAPDGAKIYATTCASCHQPDGAGKEAAYPPLGGSEWVAGPESRLIRIVLHGLTGPVEVQGETFEGLMPPWGASLKDEEVAAVLTYIRGSWGNKAPAVLPAAVRAVRAATADRKTPWTAKELLQVLKH